MFCRFVVDLRLIMRGQVQEPCPALFMQDSARAFSDTRTHTQWHMQTHTCAAGAAAALKRSLVSSCYANASKRLSENYI